ncbi:nuclear transport factor 2 family protein [Phyllobacterium myrsinacearum]|uniref:Ketosteroid isomerase-like protein n=1 Tax=Phyllobacterium myrsinacearum TaxID=28101 RepID=A0A839EUS2_9HYPH|nr:nuclear transport factor 2 family protein [Phyllobacterium myrsinacearum]MBA8881855.1 ketosteroid isomerase-like protein [Phyllobacterium myrsinacearum]
MSSTSSDAMSLERLARFGEDWRRHDLDACMGYFTDDAVYAASTGPGPGTIFAGRQAIQDELARIFRSLEPGSFKPGACSISGNRGFALWELERRMPDGSIIIFEGIDVFEFRGNFLTLKDSYRKTFA